MRPGCLADATDKAQLAELKTLGQLVARARKANVQSIVEGPGHIPLNQIEKNVKLEKKYCHEAPFYVLGPLVTDIAPGYDHITAAIGGALAGMYGADYLCYVTPSEHLSLPTVDDVREGVIVTKIAAHAADVAKGIGLERDRAMAVARKKLDWEKQFALAIDKEKAISYRKKRPPRNESVCTMCGDYCAIKFVRGYFA
jgi:phosphomethylpyrimidine synthase